MSEPSKKRNVLVSELAKDPDMVELVEMFIAELPDRIAAMVNALVEKDKEQIARLAHQLKGSAGGYGFPQITEAAKELETCAKTEEEIERLTKEIKELAALCENARATPE